MRPTLLCLCGLLIFVTATMSGCAEEEPGPEATQVGTITINPAPDGVNASWQLLGPNEFTRSGVGGATIGEMTVGNYTLTWAAVPDWTTPNPEVVTRTLVEDETLTFTGTYVAQHPVLNPSNGHYYAVIDAPVNWEEANLQASSLEYNGVSGHLVTVTNAAENQFLTGTFGGDALHYHWMGGFQPAGSPEPDGGWSWVTGEAFVYRNGSFANNTWGTENRIVFDHGVVGDGKQWNDLTGTMITEGFVVEYEPVVAAEASPRGGVKALFN
jgi:hypothetical protein